jgi:hypothetical protein
MNGTGFVPRPAGDSSGTMTGNSEPPGRDFSGPGSPTRKRATDPLPIFEDMGEEVPNGIAGYMSGSVNSGYGASEPRRRRGS